MIAQQLKAAANASNDEVARAKARLSLSVLTALEGTRASAEDMARQMLLTRTVASAADVAQRIAAVSTADGGAAKALLQRAPSMWRWAIFAPCRC